MRKFSYILSAFVLAACGGGGDSDQSSSTRTIQSAPVSDPTLKVSVSRTNVLIDEEFELQWQSSYTNSCSISARETVQSSTNGKMKLSYLSAGDKEINVKCSSNDKSVSEIIKISVNAATTYSVKTNIQEVNYYQDYITPTKNSADLEIDKCDLDPAVITYPKDWIGSRPLPTHNGRSLDPSLGRMIYIKDAMGKNNPAEIKGCSGDLKKEIKETLIRIKHLGADWVALPQWQWIGKKADGSWYIMTTEESSNGGARLNDDEFSYAVKEAKALGLKVFTWNQIQGMSDNKNPHTQPEITFENLEKWFVAYNEFMGRRADFFQSLGVDMWELSCVGCVRVQIQHDDDPKKIEYMRNQYKQIAKVVDSKFSGKLVMSPDIWLKDTPEVLNVVDYIFTGFYIFGDVTESQEENLDVNTLKQLYKPSVDMLKNNVYGKPLFLGTGLFSRKTAISGKDDDYVDEICDMIVCKAPNWTPDFALQAIHHQAIFELIDEMNLKDGSIVGVADMLVVEQLTPHQLYPNVMMSIRNKPAEGIVKNWFKK